MADPTRVKSFGPGPITSVDESMNKTSLRLSRLPHPTSALPFPPHPEGGSVLLSASQLGTSTKKHTPLLPAFI